jgi:hypothetical protein
MGICMRGLRKPTKATIRVTGFPSEIRTGHLPSTNQKLPLEPTCSARFDVIFKYTPTSPECSLLFGLSAYSVLQVSVLNMKAFNNFFHKKYS